MHQSTTIFFVFVILTSLALKIVSSNTIYSKIYLHYPSTSSDQHRSLGVQIYPGFQIQTFYYLASSEYTSTNIHSINTVNLSGVTCGMTEKFKSLALCTLTVFFFGFGVFQVFYVLGFLIAWLVGWLVGFLCLIKECIIKRDWNSASPMGQVASANENPFCKFQITTNDPTALNRVLFGFVLFGFFFKTSQLQFSLIKNFRK